MPAPLTAAAAYVLFPVAAHLAPSPTQNNRYAKIDLGTSQVRIAYTLYFGDRPGVAERRRMDQDRSGTIDDDETRRFGEEILSEIAPNLDVELDGARPAARFTITDVGLGTPVTAGGAFSVDLALEAPLSPGAARHTLRGRKEHARRT